MGCYMDPSPNDSSILLLARSMTSRQSQFTSIGCLFLLIHLSAGVSFFWISSVQAHATSIFIAALTHWLGWNFRCHAHATVRPFARLVLDSSTLFRSCSLMTADSIITIPASFPRIPCRLYLLPRFKGSFHQGLVQNYGNHPSLYQTSTH